MVHTEQENVQDEKKEQGEEAPPSWEVLTLVDDVLHYRPSPESSILSFPHKAYVFVHEDFGWRNKGGNSILGPDGREIFRADTETSPNATPHKCVFRISNSRNIPLMRIKLRMGMIGTHHWDVERIIEEPQTPPKEPLVDEEAALLKAVPVATIDTRILLGHLSYHISTPLSHLSLKGKWTHDDCKLVDDKEHSTVASMTPVNSGHPAKEHHVRIDFEPKADILFALTAILLNAQVTLHKETEFLSSIIA